MRASWLLINALLAVADALICAPFAARSPHSARMASPILMPRERGERLLLVDGNNLMSQRKVTKGREALAEKLSGVRGGPCVLVFDGKRGEEASVSAGKDPLVVVTAGGDESDGSGRITADEWIEDEIERTNYERVEVVTADRALRASCHQSKVKTINPVKFWRRYLQRIKGLKNDYVNAPKEA